MTYRTICICAIFAIAAVGVTAQSGPRVEVKLSLGDGKSSYRAGEPIILVMTFKAFSEGYSVRMGQDVNDTIMDEVMITYQWRGRMEKTV